MLLVEPAAPAPVTDPGTDRRPNILLIQTDDQDWQHSLAQVRPSGEYVMANLRALIDQGVWFANTVQPLAQCCPARATTLSGQYPHNHGVLDNEPPFGGYHQLDHSSTVARALRDAGYYTIHVGKYLNWYLPDANAHPPPGWDRWFTLIGYDLINYYGYKIQEDGPRQHSFGHAASDYQTDVLTAKALEYLRKRDFGDRPLFLRLDYSAPHIAVGGVTPAPRHTGAMAGTAYPRSPSFNEADVSDKPKNVASLPLLSPRQMREMAEEYQDSMEALMAVDEGIGRIVAALKEAGEYDDTIILFSVDNGVMMGEHRIAGGKLRPYEATRVPLVVTGPGIPRGIVNDRLVSTVDIVPTLLEWGRAAPLVEQDGRSLVPLLAQAEDPSYVFREEALIESPLSMMYGLYTQDGTGSEYMYMEYDYDKDGRVDERELYPLTADGISPADPFMLQNRARDPRYALLMRSLSARLAALKGCAGAECL